MATEASRSSQNLRSQSDRYTLGSLSQKQRELHGQVDRFLVLSIVGIHPFGDFRIEHHLFREFRQTPLDVPAGSIRVPGEDVPPVSLTVHQQILLPYLDQRPEYGRITVRMQLHRLSDYRGHLRISPVIDLEHRMEHTSLDRFQPVIDMRHGPLENDVRGIVQKPLLEHSGKPVFPAAVVQQLVVFPGRFTLSHFLVEVLVIDIFHVLFHIFSS